MPTASAILLRLTLSGSAKPRANAASISGVAAAAPIAHTASAMLCRTSSSGSPKTQANAARNSLLAAMASIPRTPINNMSHAMSYNTSSPKASVTNLSCLATTSTMLCRTCVSGSAKPRASATRNSGVSAAAPILTIAPAMLYRTSSFGSFKP